MSRPRVSIGVPVYNGHLYLEQALRSLLEQSYTDFEIIVCDNASTDSTPEICQHFVAEDERVRYHRNAKNIGANPNFNRTLELATGEYFKWAAYDDVCEPSYLARCVAALDADPSAALAHSRTAVIDDTNCRIDTDPEALAAMGLTVRDVQDPPRKLSSGSPSQRYADILLQTKWCFEIFALFRTDVLRATGELGDFYGFDKVLLATLALKGRFIEIDEELFLRRHHAGQSSQIKTAVHRAVYAGAARPGGMLASQRKCLAGYWRAIRVSRLGLGDRIACHAVILRYLLQTKKWSAIYRDIGLASPARPKLVAANRDPLGN